MHWRQRLLAAVCVLLMVYLTIELSPARTVSSAAVVDSVPVMTRNLYLGAI
jgi:hypothetical protein